MLRKPLERLSRKVVLRRSLPRKFGGQRIYVTPGNSLRYWRFDLGRVDPGLFRSVAELVKPGMSVWDVGANCGLLTFSAANLAGPGGSVLAIEPDLDNVDLLHRSLARLDRSKNAKIDILPVALAGHGTRIGRFQIAERSRASNALEGYGVETAGGFRDSRLVPLMTLDELLVEFRKPDFIKIDAEGAELAILRGGDRVFTEARPTLLIEVSGANTSAFFAQMQIWNYRLFAAETPLEKRQECLEVTGNVLAIPK